MSCRMGFWFHNSAGRRTISRLAALLLVVSFYACGSGSGTDDGTAFVNGWILLNRDRDSLTRSIEAAKRFGVNHIQLSHDLIMNIDDLMGNEPETLERVDDLEFAAELAHENGMQTFVWAHELSDAGPDVCYDAADPAWRQRAAAYRQGLARVPGVDGVVLMFGSAPLPPWFSLCTCVWCAENFPGANAFEAPPNDERIRIVTEQIGSALTGELAKKLVARTFVHEPAENDWHSRGFAAVEGLDFLGMHKSDEQDWQPYNPPSPTLGREGEHDALLEMDVAGEYYGLSALPFCAPAYFAWRLDQIWDKRGIGAAVRIERGSHTALGTPNEANLYAISGRLKDHNLPLQDAWDEFIADFYDLQPGDPGRDTLQAILADTFAIRLKSHYLLGIWAMEKSSDIPVNTVLDQFNDRGKMPKFDPDWQPVWDALDKPDRRVVLWVWQEGSEAVELAEADLLAGRALDGKIASAAYGDLLHLLKYQKYAAGVFRAVKLFIWAARARSQGDGDPDLAAWMQWAREDLERIRGAMLTDDLGDVPIAGPGRIRQFLDNTAGLVPAGTSAREPAAALFSALKIEKLSPTSAQLSFTARRQADVALDFGLEIPDFVQTIEIRQVAAGETRRVTLDNLVPRSRYVARLRTGAGDDEYTSGYLWIFTPLSGE